MRITVGLDDPASWVYSLPDSMHVNQFRIVMPGPDMVFSQEVRQAAEGYIEPALRKVWAIRLTSGGDDEMLYPAGGTFWSFENSALTGADPPPTMTPEPFPRWRPGNPGLSLSQIEHCVTWYVRGLDDVTAWQMRLLNGLGFTGYYQLVTPGDGTRPDVQEAVEQQNLPNDGTTDVGPSGTGTTRCFRTRPTWSPTFPWWRISRAVTTPASRGTPVIKRRHRRSRPTIWIPGRRNDG